MKDIFDLTGKTALITGASSGLGERFAQTLAQAGAKVILTARRFEKLQAISDALKEQGFDSLPIEMDVASKKSVFNTFKKLEDAGEKIDISVNNAGIAKRTPIFEPDTDDVFEGVIQTNLMGVWYVAQASAMHMKNHNIEGSIINIGSVCGDKVPGGLATAYSIAKAAVIHMTKSLVGELSPYKIRINCISPGWFRTPMNSSSVDNVKKIIPMQNIAEPKDMDGLILYLASNKASAYVQGSCFTIDGGISWGGKT